MRYRLNVDRLGQMLAASTISQNHWALRLGFSRGHWSDIVNGRHAYLSSKTRQRMTEVFGVSDLFIPEPNQQDAEVDFRIAISGRYELTGELGHGGMGTVYLANDLALGRLVALKVVAAEAVAGVGADQLLKEIAHISRLQHPNILPVFDAGAGAGSPFYVMPFIRSGSLGARLRGRGRLPLGEVTQLVGAIAAALGHAHEHRILHCDIKPENILVDGAHAYVMDFGIARKLHAEAEEWTALRKELDFSAGTPGYVSPEQAVGDRALDERSDVYSLACVVYEMLSGRQAFTGSNTQEIVSLRFREPPPPLQQFAPDVPYAVARVIETAMSLDPDRRPRTAAQFADSLAFAARSASPVRTSLGVAATRVRWWLTSWTGQRPRSTRAGALARWIDTLRQDVVYALRQRRRAPGLTAVSLVTLALGIGMTTAVYAIVDGVMLRPLPFANAERLVALESMDSAGAPVRTVSSSNWYDWKHENRVLDGVAIYTHEGLSRSSVVAAGDARRARTAQVSPEFFDVIGARFMHGRDFDSTEVALGGSSGGGAVVSERFWREHLGASRDSALSIAINGFTTPVIGVVANGQEFPVGTEVWTAVRHRQIGGATRNNINWLAVGRLRRDASIVQAETDLAGVAQRIRESTPGTLYSFGVRVLPLREQLVGDTTSLLRLLGASVAVVLLIACANLASANLAQGAQRQREMAVRVALGAGRRRLVRQVLVENVLLALVGGTAGVALAWLLVRSAAIVQVAQLPDVTRIAIDARVLLVALAVSSLAGLLTGILPALAASRAAPNDILGGSARGTAFGGRGLPGRALVVAEIAMALMLVAGAGLLVQSMRALLARPLGFETNHVLAATVTLGGPQYQQDSVAYFAYWNRLIDALREVPGVRNAGLTQQVPTVNGGTGFIEIEGSDVQRATADYRMISEGYFEALGIATRAGRTFESADGKGSPRIAVINQRMAETYWPSESALGKRIRATSMEPSITGDPPEWITVVGVVSDVRHFGYADEPDPEMFVLYRQLSSWRIGTLTALVRGAGADADLLQRVRATVASVDEATPADYEFLESAAARGVAPRRFAMLVLEAFGVLALMLAAIGVYGVLSFSVAQRTRELAVRSALGADRGTLLRMVLGSGVAVVGAGLVIGVVGALASGRVIESLLFEVRPQDPVVLGVAATIVAAFGIVAAVIPARRATRIHPMTVLRND